MAEQLQLVKEAYAALARGDNAAFLELMDPAVEWHESGPSGFPPPGGGRTSLTPRMVLRDVLEPIAATWDDFTVDAQDFIDAGERVVVTGRYQGRAKATGKVLDAPFVHVWTSRHGKLCRFQDFPDTARVLQALSRVPE